MHTVVEDSPPERVWRPGEIKVGDMVLFPQFVGNKLSNWNHRALAAEWGEDIPDNLWIMKESEVIAVVEV